MVISLEVERPCNAKQSKIQLNAFYHYSGVTSSLQATVVIFFHVSQASKENARRARGPRHSRVPRLTRSPRACPVFSLGKAKSTAALQLSFHYGIFFFYRQIDK